MDLFIYVLWLGPSLGTVVCLFMLRPLPPYSAFWACLCACSFLNPQVRTMVLVVPLSPLSPQGFGPFCSAPQVLIGDFYGPVGS